MVKRGSDSVDMKNYSEFLQGKKVTINRAGFSLAREEINPKLFHFQADIVRWAIEKGRAAIFAACGLGKTPMQLEWACQVANYTESPVLIIAPLAVTYQTKKEGIKFDIEVKICRDNKDVITGINIINYEIIDKFDLLAFSGVVLDESSILKNAFGKTRTALINMLSHIPYRLACTATPSPNDTVELGNHAEFLGEMTYQEMLAKYFINDSAKTNMWRLKKYAVKDFWHWVSTWAVCLNKPSDLGYSDDGFELPQLNWHELVVETPKSGSKQGFFYLDDALVSATDLHRNLRETAEERSIAINELVRGSSSDYWLIWVNTNYEADILRKLIPESVEIRGSDPPEVKERRLIDFSEGRIKYLITKPTIAGFGMNWQHCHKMVFMGINYSFEQAYQAVRRVWRFGQQEPVDVYTVISDKEVCVLDSVKEKAAKHNQMEQNMINLTSFKAEKLMTTSQREIYEGEKWKLIQGDCVVEMKTIPDESIHFSIFSPPFSSIFVYSDFIEDMGNSLNDAEFFSHFSFLVPELLRVTKPGRICAVHCSLLPSFKYKGDEIGIKDFRGDIIRLFQSHGWIFHSEICIWKCPVIEVTRTKAVGLLHKQLKKDSTMCRVGIPDHIVAFRKPGENPEPVTHDDSNFPVSEWQKIASPVWMDIRQGNTLNFKAARAERDERHICPLQLDVIERCLRLWTNPDDLVLSPFAGIGSEGYQALKMGRRFIGIELKPEYAKQAVLNLKKAKYSVGFFD